MTALAFDQIRLPPECDELRDEVRAFLADEVSRGTFDPTAPATATRTRKEFSRRIGAKGWIGMTWPKKYGGRERNSSNAMW
jgi:alkylation response protein AidB-like acyl-CoA dehydrogenase